MDCNLTMCNVDCPGRAARDVYTRGRRCWMCAYFESDKCHAMPPAAYVKKVETVSVRPDVNPFDLGCSLFVRGDDSFKPYRTDVEVN